MDNNSDSIFDNSAAQDVAPPATPTAAYGRLRPPSFVFHDEKMKKSEDKKSEDKKSEDKNKEEAVSEQLQEDIKGATHVYYEVLFDGSSSMTMMPTAPEALQKFIMGQKDYCIENNITTDFTLTIFDTTSRAVPGFTNVDLKDTEPIQTDVLKPRGYTRLIDTALERIIELKKRVLSPTDETAADEPKEESADEPKWVGVFVLLTDGEDNQSRFSSEKLNKEIKNLSDNGIQCYFLGANQNAINTGRQFGFSEEQSLTYDGAAAMEAMRSASENISRGLNSGGTVQPGFTQLQRDISGGTPSQPLTQDDSDEATYPTDVSSSYTAYGRKVMLHRDTDNTVPLTYQNAIPGKFKSPRNVVGGGLGELGSPRLTRALTGDNP